MKTPTFSICIPNYNYGKYIGDTIQSVLDQTYQDFEIIIADNASIDNSMDVIRLFNDPRIRIIQNHYNIGFAPNLQRATQYAQGDFINLLSSDDQMKPHALETYATVIAAYPEDRTRLLLFSIAECFDDTGKITSYMQKAQNGFYIDHIPPYDLPTLDPNAPSYEVYDSRTVLRESLGQLKNYAPFLSVIYSRQLWEQIEGYNSIRTIGPDKHFAYKILMMNPMVIHIPHVLYRYRDFPSSNRTAENTTLRRPIDDYFYTLEMSDEKLKEIGLSKEQLIHTLLNEMCLKKGLSALGYRNYRHAFQLWTFALSSYPGRALRLPRTYLLMGLLALGPVAPIVAPWMLKLYHRIRGTK